MKKPYIKQIKPSQGKDEALVFLNGYQQRDKDNRSRWCKYLRDAGWKGSIYQLWWDGGSKEGRKRAMSPLGHIPVLNGYIHYYPHWKMVVKRATISGSKYLPSLLSKIAETKISFIGYSLGCRVIHYGMQKFNPKSSGKTIDNIFLLAGAVHTTKWEKIAPKIEGKIYNFYNKRDWTLNWAFSHFRLYNKKPCGISPIKTNSKNIKNIDITKIVNTKSHSLGKNLKMLDRFDYLK